MISKMIKPLIPIVRKHLEMGKIEELLDTAKVESCKDFQLNDGGTIEYMITKRVIDEKPCYLVVFVELTSQDVVIPLKTYKLLDLINLILEKI